MYITHMHYRGLSIHDWVPAVWVTVVVLAQRRLLCVAFDMDAIAVCVTSYFVASDSCVVVASEGIIAVCVAAYV
jgi:hypothetical protein